MRILLINHFPLQGSGSGVYTANIAKSLEKKGHKTCIITPENTSNFSNIKNIKLHPVFFKYKEEIENQQDFNFACFDPHPRSSLLFSDMTEEQIKKYEDAFREAIRIEIEEFKPDIIHAQHIWIISSIATEFNIPLVITSHGSDIMGYEWWEEFHHYAHNAANKCNRIIAISNHSKDEITNIFKEDSDKVTTMLNGYDERVFYRKRYNRRKVLNKLGINKNYKYVVCFSGRLAKNKGIDLLLKAAKIYEDDNVITLIAGDGEEYKYLKKLKEELQLKHVVFLGHKDASTLREIYNVSDVCVVPSRQEAFGLVALEAIACGTPVVASNQGGIPDFVTQEVGILIEKENVEQLSEAIIKTLNKEKKYNYRKIANYAKNNYKQDTLIGKLIDVYKSALNEKRRNGKVCTEE